MADEIPSKVDFQPCKEACCIGQELQNEESLRNAAQMNY